MTWEEALDDREEAFNEEETQHQNGQEDEEDTPSPPVKKYLEDILEALQSEKGDMYKKLKPSLDDGSRWFHPDNPLHKMHSDMSKSPDGFYLPSVYFWDPLSLLVHRLSKVPQQIQS